MRALGFHERVTVIGMTFSGKSQFVKTELIRDAGYRKIVVWDLHGEYNRDALTQASYSVPEFAQMLTGRLQYVERLSVRPTRRQTPDEIADEFSDFVRLCESRLSDTLIIIEECIQFEESKKAQARLSYLATESRHWHCPLVFVAQRFIMIPPSARNQSSRIYSFRQISKNDKRELEPFFGEAVDRLMTLETGHCLSYDSERPEPIKPTQTKLGL